MSKSTPPIMGVYRILNTGSGKFYIGSSNNVRSRLSAHRSALRNGRHWLPSLQGDWDALGEISFEIAVLETVDTLEDIRVREQWYLDELRPFDPAIGYNRSPRADSVGWKYTDEQRERLAASLRGKPKTAEHRAKIWANREVTDAHRENMSRVGKLGRGVPKTAEHNRKNSEANRGERSNSAKLNNVQVADIKRRLADGVKGAHLAVEYSISQAVISNIKTGKRWAHVPAAPVEPTSI